MQQPVLLLASQAQMLLRSLQRNISLPTCADRATLCSVQRLKRIHVQNQAAVINRCCSLLSFSTSAQPINADALGLSLVFTGNLKHEYTAPLLEANLQGKGRGLVASHNLAAGDLVLVRQPIAILHGPQDHMPPAELLVEHLRRSWTELRSEQRNALASMYAGVSSATLNSSDPAAATAAGAGGSSGRDSQPVDFGRVVALNAFGDDYEDLAAAQLRGATPHSHVGIWPTFNLLNHSCLPNCVHYVVGSVMVVRAVQAVAAGQELTISYLGREEMAPAQVRQAALSERYGFRCSCSRCSTEAALPARLRSLLLELHHAARKKLQELEQVAGQGVQLQPQASPLGVAAIAAASKHQHAPQLQQQLEEEEESLGEWLESQASQLHEELHQLQLQGSGSVDGSGGATGPGSTDADEPEHDDDSGGVLGRAAAGVGSEQDGEGQVTPVQAAQAAAYELMELLHLHEQLSGESTGLAGGFGGGRHTLEACWHIMDAVSRGSELQVYQACEMLRMATKDGTDKARVREAAGMLGQSLVARYGRMTAGPELIELTKASMRVSKQFFS